MNNVYNGNPSKIIISLLLCFLNIVFVNFNITFFKSNLFFLNNYLITSEHIKQIIIFNIKSYDQQNYLYILYSFLNIFFSILYYKLYNYIFSKIILSLNFLIKLNFMLSLANIIVKNSNEYVSYFYYFNYIFILTIVNTVIISIIAFIKINIFFTNINQKIDNYLFNSLSCIAGIYYFIFIYNEFQSFNLINIFYYIFIIYLVVMLTFNFGLHLRLKSIHIFYPFSFGFVISFYLIYKKSFSDSEIFLLNLYTYYYINHITNNDNSKNIYTFYINNLIKNSLPILISYNFSENNNSYNLSHSLFFSLSLLALNLLNSFFIKDKSFVKIYKKNDSYFYANNKLFIEKNCPICIEDYQINDNIVIVNCNHVFHKKCFDDWLLFKNICPVCRNFDIESTKNSIFS